MSKQFQISRDSQALYITTVAKDRLPVFQTDAIKKMACEARGFGMGMPTRTSR